jgi:hypothetical protein
MEADASMSGSTEDCELRADDDIDPLDGIAFGPLFVEKLLLAIIDGNPIAGKDRRGRLNKALVALLGSKSLPGPLPPDPNKAVVPLEVQLDQALLWMATEYFRAGRKTPPDSALAKRAADKFFPTANADHRKTRIDDLRQRFSGSYDKKLKGWNPDNHANARQTYLYRAVQHDYVAESVEAQVLRRIKEECAQAGLRMILPEH